MTKKTSRLVRLGSARTLTRAVSRGEFDELNQKILKGAQS